MECGDREGFHPVEQVEQIEDRTSELEQEAAQRAKAAGESMSRIQRLRELFDYLSVGVFQTSIDPKGRFLHANLALAKILGYTDPSELKQVDFADHFLEEHAFKRLVEQVLREMSVRGYEARVRRLEGDSVWISVSARVRYHHAQKVIRIDGIVEDITRRKQVEDEVRKLNEELEERIRERTARLQESVDALKESQNQMLQMQKLEAVGALAAGVAHEINTPIQYVGDNLRFFEDVVADYHHLIEGYVDLREALSKGSDTAPLVEHVVALEEEIGVDELREEIQKALREAQEGVQRVTSIVRAMKDFSHPGGAMEPYDINDGIRTTLTVARNEYKYHADVELDLDESLPPVPCDQGGVKQVLLNIIVNAAQAIGERHAAERARGESTRRGTIRIATRREGDDLIVSISDTGCGIPESVRERIFEPFFTTKPVGKGSGQGLAIVHRIIAKQHGGRLEVDSVPGEGSTFRIALPIGG